MSVDRGDDGSEADTINGNDENARVCLCCERKLNCDLNGNSFVEVTDFSVMFLYVL